MVPKTAIIGTTSFMGKFFFPEYRKIHRNCIGTSRNRSRKDLSYLDLFCPSIASLKLVESGHQEALIFAGITGLAKCEKEKEVTRKINVEGTLDLIRQLVSEGIKPIFFSSIHVFDGTTGFYDAESPLNPLNEYGRQKAEVESRIKNICKGNYLIVRLSDVYSLDKGGGTIFDEMAAIFKSGGVVRAAYDHIFSPVFILDLVRLVTILQIKNVTGVINISPPEIWSRYDLALALANCMEVSSKQVEKIALDDLQETFKRPKNTSMKADKVIRETGYTFTPTIQYIERIAESRIENDIVPHFLNP